MKKVSLMFVSLIILLIITPKALSAPNNNPIFATIEYVQNIFQQNQTDLDFLRERTRVLEERIEEIESEGLPDGKWVHVCFDVASKNLSVMKNGTCFPHVQWKIFVQCFPGTPCLPDNPFDTYFVAPQEQ